jgi:hypothetical protein
MLLNYEIQDLYLVALQTASWAISDWDRSSYDCNKRLWRQLYPLVQLVTSHKSAYHSTLLIHSLLTVSLNEIYDQHVLEVNNYILTGPI